MAIKPPLVRNPYNYDMQEASKESALTCPEPTLAQQQFAEESDINYIAEKYGLTGEMPQVLNLPRYGDFSGIFDFQSAQNAVRKAINEFLTLPAKLRNRFDNDPQKLLQFLDDPDNKAEAEFLGLVKKQPETVPQSPTGPQAAPAETGKGGNPTPPPAKPEGPPSTDT